MMQANWRVVELSNSPSDGSPLDDLGLGGGHNTDDLVVEELEDAVDSVIVGDLLVLFDGKLSGIVY
jgi:hypothetical protein